MSLVRLCGVSYEIEEAEWFRAGEIWPQLNDVPYDKRWGIGLEDKFIDINDVPPWIADAKGIYLKPIPKVQFVQPPPKFTTGSVAEIKEFVRNVNQIVMPGFELLRYGAIQVIEDACTDAIQRELDHGWRIIAVLPQPQKRRPDYILVRELKE